MKRWTAVMDRNFRPSTLQTIVQELYHNQIILFPISDSLDCEHHTSNGRTYHGFGDWEDFWPNLLENLLHKARMDKSKSNCFTYFL